MLKEKNITKLIFILPILFTALATFSTYYISTTFLNTYFKHELEILKLKELELQKENIKNRVYTFYNYLSYKKQESESRLKEKLKTRVYMVHRLMMELYENKKNKLSKEELQKEILNYVREIRFGKDGYFFIAHIKNSREIISKLLPSTPHIENINTYNHKDLNGKFYVRSLANIAISGKNNEGFEEYSFAKLSKKGQYSKLSFVKLFKPYNWLVGYGEYIEDFEIQLKNEVKKRLNFYNFNENNYIWIHDKNYNLIFHPYRKEDIGKNDENLLDIKNTKIIKLFVDTALKNKNNDFIEYYWNKPNQHEHLKKIAFVKYFKDWQWVIGSGVYLEDIDLLLEKIKAKKENEIKNLIVNIIFIIVFIISFVSIVSYIISKRVKNSFLEYRKEIEKNKDELEIKVDNKTRELKELNEKLEEKIAQRVEELKEKDRALAQQSKMIALAEMMGNIAHQWRQPLSTISTAASGLKLKKEMNILTDKDINQFSDGIVNSANYLSQVIEDFKNYIKDEKEKTEFLLDEVISNSIDIFESSLYNYKIKIIKDIEKNIILKTYKAELIQIIMVVLNNAKDALIKCQENENDRIIFISTHIVDNNAIITIKDSACGIDEDIRSKVFEPYFTTKDKDQGTGLGLYMAYQIVKNSMNGDIKLENSKSVYKDKSYYGVKVTISLSLDNK